MVVTLYGFLRCYYIWLTSLHPAWDFENRSAVLWVASGTPLQKGMTLSFRPHHFLCTLGFEGKGYSPKFVENYKEIVESLHHCEETPIEVTSGLDSVCRACPHNDQRVCEAEAKVKGLDDRHAEILSLSPGDVLSWYEAKRRIKEKMTLENFHFACRGCQWKAWGVCEKELRKHRGESFLETVFSGEYRFQRFISSPCLNFAGTAVFQQVSPKYILYREDGLYVLEGVEQSCYQNRIYQLGENSLTVLKESRDVLHKFNLPKRTCFPIALKHTHHCGGDQYAVRMEIDSENKFTVVYEVTGPSKKYMIHTRYTRASGMLADDS